jgi:hypothetical protein
MLDNIFFRFEEPIDTVDQLAARNLPWGSTHDAWIFSIQLATQPVIVKLLENFRTYPKDVLEGHAKQRDMAYSIERLPYGHYAIGEYVAQDTAGEFQIMMEDIYWENCVAMSTKTWPLRELFDDLVLRIAQSGIQKYWEADIVGRFADNKVQQIIGQSRNHENVGPIKLQLTHFSGAFILWAIGLGISFLVFVGELFMGRWRMTKNGTF